MDKFGTTFQQSRRKFFSIYRRKLGLDMFPFVSVAEIFTVARETRALHYIQKSERFRTVSVQNRQKTVEKPLFFELSDMREKIGLELLHVNK